MKIDQAVVEKALLSGPGADLVRKLLMQIAAVPGFKYLFGPYEPGKDQQRYADYQRFDWSIRQLPAMNVFESGVEDKTSDEGFLNGTVIMQVFWPPSFRRSDLGRVPAAFKAAVQNFFSSSYVRDMLDELYWIERPAKVDGLNELGKTLNWSPATEGLVESELVPVTVVEIRYRIDLRAWHRALERMNRTKLDPFAKTLEDLSEIVGGTVEFPGGGIVGVSGEGAENPDVAVAMKIEVSNP